MTDTRVWILQGLRDEMYQGARALWPGLTPQQFGDAARAWVDRQPANANLSIRQVAEGLEQELRDRHGPSIEESP
jgi:hypothetical protein